MPSRPILESKSMHAIFQKTGKKGQNIWKFVQKCTKFENILKKGYLIWYLIEKSEVSKLRDELFEA